MKFLIAACLSFGFLMSSAGATIVQSLTMPEMAQKADVIVHGRIVDQSSSWDEKRTRIYTVTDIAVTEGLKGTPEKIIRIRQLGGTVDGINQSIVGNAKLKVGEEAVLFLKFDPAKKLHYVLGMAQGKYTVNTQGPVPTVGHALNGLALAHIEQGQLATLKHAPAPQSVPTLVEFKAQIKAVVAPRKTP